MTVYRGNGQYTGTLSPDRKVARGTATWYGGGTFWLAKIEERRFHKWQRELLSKAFCARPTAA